MKIEFENLKCLNSQGKLSFSLQAKQNIAVFEQDKAILENLLQTLAQHLPLIVGKIYKDAVAIAQWDLNLALIEEDSKGFLPFLPIHLNLYRRLRKNSYLFQKQKLEKKGVILALNNCKNTHTNGTLATFKTEFMALIKNFSANNIATRAEVVQEYLQDLQTQIMLVLETNLKLSSEADYFWFLYNRILMGEYKAIYATEIIFQEALKDKISVLKNLVDEFEKEKMIKTFNQGFVLTIDEQLNVLQMESLNTKNQQKAYEKLLKIMADNEETIFLKLFPEFITSDKINYEVGVEAIQALRQKFVEQQNFFAFNILPDAMHLLIRDTKTLIATYYEQMLQEPVLLEEATYQANLARWQHKNNSIYHTWQDQLQKTFQKLNYPKILKNYFNNLPLLEQKIVLIVEKLQQGCDGIIWHEPLLYLNKAEKAALKTVLLELQTEFGVGLIFSAKKEEDFQLLATDVLVLDEGKLLQMEPLADITEKPLALNLLEELAHHHLNKSENIVIENQQLLFYDQVLQTSPTTSPVLIAFKCNAGAFVLKKPVLKQFITKKMIFIPVLYTHFEVIKPQVYLWYFTSVAGETFKMEFSAAPTMQVNTPGFLKILKKDLFVFDAQTHVAINKPQGVRWNTQF